MIKKILVNYSTTVKECLVKLENNEQKCLIVVKNQNVFYGTLTDGDIRRAIILGARLDDKIKNYAKKKNFTINQNKFKKLNPNEVLKLIKQFPEKKIELIPVIGKNKKVVDFIDTKKIIENKDKIEVKKNKLKKTPLVLMAGGRGLRLKPFTNMFPKALIPVSNVSAAEHILNFFKAEGIKKFYITVNYKKKLIKSYLEEKNLNIKYIEEKKELGTAGSLSYLKNKIKEDFFVSNCDTILKFNLQNLYDYHVKNNFFITIVVATKNFQLPYGSCEIDKKGNLKRITEKPKFNYLVNAGLYVMKPAVLKFVKNNLSFDMDELIKLLKKKKKKIGVFPISETDWTDIGEWSDYNKLILNSSKSFNN